MVLVPRSQSISETAHDLALTQSWIWELAEPPFGTSKVEVAVVEQQNPLEVA